MRRIKLWLKYQWHLMDGSAGGSCYYGCPICREYESVKGRGDE